MSRIRARRDPVDGLVHTLESTRISVLQRAFRQLGWTLSLAVAEDPPADQYTPADYYLLFGDDTTSVSCRPCSDGIFEHPGDRYWQAFPNGIGLDVLLAAARRHHDQQHTATPEEPTP